MITSSPGYHFGGDKRDSPGKNQVPGPGSYEQNLIKSRTSGKIGQKIQDLKSSYVPGPGSYEA